MTPVSAMETFIFEHIIALKNTLACGLGYCDDRGVFQFAFHGDREVALANLTRFTAVSKRNKIDAMVLPNNATGSASLFS